MDNYKVIKCYNRDCGRFSSTSSRKGKKCPFCGKMISLTAEDKMGKLATIHYRDLSSIQASIRVAGLNRKYFEVM